MLLEPLGSRFRSTDFVLLSDEQWELIVSME
jgi:hypothetical protein